MNSISNTGGPRGVNWWRVGGWSFAAGLLALPAVAMQFTREVNWTLSDFVVIGAMLATAGAGIEFLMRRSGSASYRVGAIVALVTGFMLVWVNLAVGLIGSENNDANMMYAAVLAIATGGSIVAHFRARGMALAFATTAAAQVAAGVIALAFDLGTDGRAWPRDVIGATVIWTSLWLAAAGLFLHAARSRSQR